MNQVYVASDALQPVKVTEFGCDSLYGITTSPDGHFETGKRQGRLVVCNTRNGMYKRVVLKLSGEALAGERGFGLDADKVSEISNELAEIHALGVEIGLVVGGGNFFRGVEEQAKEMDRVGADNMGMLSTVINAIALQDALERMNVQCRVMSAVAMNQIAEPYIRRRAVRHLEKGRIVVF